MPLSMLNVILAPNLEAAKGVVADVSVEAEYGSVVCEGSVLTLAHHQPDGPYSSKVLSARAPCCAQSLIAEHSQALKATLSRKAQVTVLISHFDLDTVGGIARVLAEITGLGGDSALFTNHESFWRLAEFVDLNGAHRVTRAPDGLASDKNVAALHAFWAYSHTRDRLKPSDQANDVTFEVENAIMALNDILVAKDKGRLAQGAKHAEEAAKLDAHSFIEAHGNGVIVRCAPTFVNHLYGADGRAVVAFNPALGSVTMSLADPVPGVSCRKLVQELFGPEAGGHDGIAGSPRGKRMTMSDWWAAIELLELVLDGKKSKA